MERFCRQPGTAGGRALRPASGWWPEPASGQYFGGVTGPRRSPSWRRQFHQGRRALRGHRNRRALDLLTAAAASCPAAQRAGLAATLRWLGFVCARLGRRGAALRCWVDAQRAHKQPGLARLIRTCSNDHGMPRQGHRLLDDWRAFHSLQLARYVRAKERVPLGAAETDMLRDLLWGHFTELVRRGALRGRTAEQRRRLFAAMQVTFPLLLPAAAGTERVVAADFLRRRRPVDGDPCVCGSGLPYVVCCGRIPTSDEIATGS